MPDHHQNRDAIVAALREELVGPSPQGAELDCTGSVRFSEQKESYGPWRVKGTGEEILQRDSPAKRYGVAVLYPINTLATDDDDTKEPPTDGPATDRDDEPSSALTEEGIKNIDKVAGRVARAAKTEVDSDDLDLSPATSFRPSSIGVSFLSLLPDASELVVEVSGGGYRRFSVTIGTQERFWWRRSQITGSARFTASELLAKQGMIRKPLVGDELDGLDLRLEVFSRPRAGASALLTVCLVNRTPSAGASASETSLFQSHFRATVTSSDTRACIQPYPTPSAERRKDGSRSASDDEEESLALLYREMQTFAVGHGCAADWKFSGDRDHAISVSAECLPQFETPSTTPDIFRDDGTPVRVSMARLGGLVSGTDGMAEVEEVVSRYEQWIGERRKSAELLVKHREVALRHLEVCDRSAERMRDGLKYLKEDPNAARAFQLANEAVLLQQIRSAPGVRIAQYDSKARRIKFSEPYMEPDPLDFGTGRGWWRPFQIAFFLMCIRSTGDGRSDTRETVELLWFPTGGGKTEAYLGLAAFAMFMRRLGDPKDRGVSVLMRYTLRLLTAQQFQRASGLICAMEQMRRKRISDLGETQFSIGIWVGGSSTPNSKEEALRQFRALVRQEQNAENPFLLVRCPWCRAQLGPLNHPRGTPTQAPKVLGYEQRGTTVAFTCSDPLCDFADELPVMVIDADMYDEPPSLIIGTVDKFAMLAWRPEARALFGLGQDGSRFASPPGLIIQDELHLISGPLGSMVGLYEAIIEELCTDHRDPASVVRPKIVASTATIRRYEEQVLALYARDHVVLFPSPGLSAEDSYFARYARNSDDSLQPGRMYVGVNGSSLGSQQTAEVRTFSALLQASFALSPEERDPWWTLMLFFNSLRELGVALSLLQSDVVDYLKVVWNRTDEKVRSLNNVQELTSRLRSEDVPAAIASLEVPCTATGAYPVDVCLASSIIEVGIDVPRLSLMAVVGQPKTTSQYIQVTGRVGRLWQERPGLVATIYSPSKPRDRSHFEQFRSYHERLYAQVEPTSVTPFSPPALDRALHAVMVAYVRQAGDDHLPPFPFPTTLVEDVRRVMLNRVRKVDPEEDANFERVFDHRVDQWRRWERTNWQAKWSDADIPLLRQAGSYATAERTRLSWSTPQSMRNVDAECQVEITRLYLDAPVAPILGATNVPEPGTPSTTAGG